MNYQPSQPPEAPVEPAGHGLVRWLSRGAWALLDQAAFSIAGFALVLLLGRWLDQGSFGSFTIAQTVFLLLATLYSALFVEAMLVLGPARYANRLDRYFGAVLLLQAPVALAIAALTAVVGGVIFFVHTSVATAQAVLAMAAAAPLILFLWLARKPSYVTLNPARAAIGGAVYLAVVVAGLFAAEAANRLSTITAIAVVAVASAVVGFGLFALERITFPRRGPPPDPILSDVARDHWRYGKWATASALLGLLPSQLAYLILPVFADVSAAGALRATSNLILPLIQANIAVCGLLLPALATKNLPSDGGRRRRKRLISAAVLIAVVLPILAWGVIGVFAEPVLRLCYGERYVSYGWLVWIIGCLPPLMGAGMILNTLLQSQQRQRAVFASSFASAVCAATVGVLLTWQDGVRGAAIGVAASLAVVVIVSGAFVIAGPRGKE